MLSSAASPIATNMLAALEKLLAAIEKLSIFLLRRQFFYCGIKTYIWYSKFLQISD